MSDIHERCQECGRPLGYPMGATVHPPICRICLDEKIRRRIKKAKEED